MRKRRLRLVQPSPRFDLEKFRTARSFEINETPAQERPPRRMTMKFARLPHVWARRLREHRISADAWYLLCELDRLILEPGGSNPVKLATEALKSMKLNRWAAGRALRWLEKAGAVIVTRHRGRAPLVKALWYWEP
jgi:hypothetical protein